jgi:hypothetical protein
VLLAVLALTCFGLGFWALLNGRGVVLFLLLEVMALLLGWAGGWLWDDSEG